MSPEIWIGLGSNQGDRRACLIYGLRRLAEISKLGCISSLYETEPWGKTDQPFFYNAVCSLFTRVTNPLEFLEALKSIERDAGRDAGVRRWGPRPLDLDILFWGSLVLNEEVLAIPHPHIAQRRFVLTPLEEVAPELRHPVSGLTVQEMLQQCSDSGTVRRIGKLELTDYSRGIPWIKRS